jgi:hypothetical protein
MSERDQGRFIPKGDESMSTKTVGCRIPVEIESILNEYFADKEKSAKSEWLRRVISEAVKKELTK